MDDTIRSARDTGDGIFAGHRVGRIGYGSDEPMVDLCMREGLASVPYFPLGSAVPDLPKATDEPAVRAVADRPDATASQVALAWLLQHSPAILLIPGTSSNEHLDANLTRDVHRDSAAVERLAALAGRAMSPRRSA